MQTGYVPSVLTAAELATFQSRGYLRVRDAFPPDLAREMQDAIWDELRDDHGIERSDRSTWRVPPHSPRRAKELALNERLASPRFQAVISDLLGGDDWQRPRTWGGFNVTFPSECDGAAVPSDTWHWDGSPTARGLLIISFYSTVPQGGGGTRILEGSHRLIADYYASLSAEDRARPHKFHRKNFLRGDPWLATLSGHSSEPVADRVAAFVERTSTVGGVPCRVVELTGEPGEAVFCNLGMLHATAPNAADDPRFVRVKFLFLD